VCSPVALLSLCLLAGMYEHATALTKRFADVQVTVGLLMSLDKLVQLIESPVYVHLRLHLLEPAKVQCGGGVKRGLTDCVRQHDKLYLALYALLALLPQVRGHSDVCSLVTWCARCRAQRLSCCEHA
jgi:hypothetical protein